MTEEPSEHPNVLRSQQLLRNATTINVLCKLRCRPRHGVGGGEAYSIEPPFRGNTPCARRLQYPVFRKEAFVEACALLSFARNDTFLPITPLLPVWRLA